MQSFSELKLSPGTLEAIAKMGYETPSPIQALAIPHLLAGKDLIGQARTGTGKTSAFGIPLVEAGRVSRNPGVNALILVPTRELAAQVAAELTELAHGSGIAVVTVYGGVGMGAQIASLKRHGVTLLVATPGRLLDHINQRTVNLERVEKLVLDEADRMLDMGFLRDVEKILNQLPRARHTALFSATMPEPIRKLSDRFLRNPTTVRVEQGPEATPTAEQFKVAAEKSLKTRTLLALLAKEKPERAIVFTRTKHLAKRLAHSLARSGWNAVALQGNMSQAQRERAMAAFRAGEAKLLVATDIAGRGIDVPEVSHVVNYDLPTVPEDYVHRIGRTGRMGRTGRAFTFVQSDEVPDMRQIQRISPVEINHFDVGPLPPEPEPVGRPQGNSQPGDRPGPQYNNHRRNPGPGHHAKKDPRPEGQHRTGSHHGPREHGGQHGGPRRESGGDERAPARTPDPRYAPGHDPKMRNDGPRGYRGGGGRSSYGDRERGMGSGSGTRLGDSYGSGRSSGGRSGGRGGGGGGRSGGGARRW